MEAMTINDKKLELIRLIIETEDENLLDFLYNSLLEKPEEEQIGDTERGIKEQLANGKPTNPFDDIDDFCLSDEDFDQALNTLDDGV